MIYPALITTLLLAHTGTRLRIDHCLVLTGSQGGLKSGEGLVTPAKHAVTPVMSAISLVSPDVFPVWDCVAVTTDRVDPLQCIAVQTIREDDGCYQPVWVLRGGWAAPVGQILADGGAAAGAGAAAAAPALAAPGRQDPGDVSVVSVRGHARHTPGPVHRGPPVVTVAAPLPGLVTVPLRERGHGATRGQGPGDGDAEPRHPGHPGPERAARLQPHHVGRAGGARGLASTGLLSTLTAVIHTWHVATGAHTWLWPLSGLPLVSLFWGQRLQSRARWSHCVTSLRVWWQLSASPLTAAALGRAWQLRMRTPAWSRGWAAAHDVALAGRTRTCAWKYLLILCRKFGRKVDGK